MIYEHTYTVGAYDVNSQMECSIPSLMKMMHEAAVQNVLDLKVSYWDLIPHRISWVLMRKRLEIHRQPKMREKIRIETFPSGFEKFYTYRDFRMYDAENNLVASGSSTWLLIDVDSRKMVRIPDFILKKKIPPPPYLERSKGKIPKLTTPDYSQSMRVGWFELDWNEHLNNIHYLKQMLDVLPLEIHQQYHLKRMDIVFKREAMYGSHLLSEVQSLETEKGHHFTHHIQNKDTQKVIAQGQTFWR